MADRTQPRAKASRRDKRIQNQAKHYAMALHGVAAQLRRRGGQALHFRVMAAKLDQLAAELRDV